MSDRDDAADPSGGQSGDRAAADGEAAVDDSTAADADPSVDESAAIESLRELGLSKYEAAVFIALQKLGTGTARDVDRITDVPRSQVYGAAESLEERGLVDVQQSSPIQYRPVGLEEARETLRERFERQQDRAFAYIERASAAHGDHDDEHEAGVWTVHGRENVDARVEQLVSDADERVFLGVPEEVLSDDLAALLEERATDIEVSAFSDDAPVRERFADGPVVTGEFSDDLADTKAGRFLAVDGEAILLSILGSENLPGRREETAIWSDDTGFATVLLELSALKLDAPVGEGL